MTWLNGGLVVFYTAGGPAAGGGRNFGIYFDRPVFRGAVDAVFKPRRFFQSLFTLLSIEKIYLYNDVSDWLMN